MTKQTPNEQLMTEATNEAAQAADANVSREHSLTTQTPGSAIAKPMQSVGIAGMEEIPTSLMAIPYCRLIQPTSQKTTNDAGKDAQPGNFLFNDTQKEVGELHFVLLRAKHELKAIDSTGQFVPTGSPDAVGQKQQVSILGITTDEREKLFILSLAVTSFSNFGKLIAKFKDLQVDKTWRFQLKATSEKIEGKKGKYFVINFAIEHELDAALLAHMEQKAIEYGLALDRQAEPEE